jgi:hypothetical protein
MHVGHNVQMICAQSCGVYLGRRYRDAEVNTQAVESPSQPEISGRATEVTVRAYSAR